MSAASVNFGQNSVLSQSAFEIMMSGITLPAHPYYIPNFLSLFDFEFCFFFFKTKTKTKNPKNQLPLTAQTELALIL